LADFSKQSRLLKKADFDKVFKKSVKVSNAHFLILIQKTSNPKSRLGLIISKKVDKRAVHRNRIKRIIRESFRNFEHIDSCDFVVLGRSNLSMFNNSELFNSLNSLWVSAKNKIQTIRNGNE
jgi:ribonuclease P protein component